MLKLFSSVTLPLPKQTNKKNQDGKVGVSKLKKKKGWLVFIVSCNVFSFLFILIKYFISNFQILRRCQCNR